MRLLTHFDPSDVATPEPPQPGSRRREEIPDRFKWNLVGHLLGLGRLGGRLQGARSRHRPVRGAEGHAVGGAERCSRRSGCPRTSDSSPIGSGTSRRCSTTRISATTPSTPGGSRCRSCSRGCSRPSPGSTPNCCRFRSRRCAAWMDAVRAAPALPVRDRESLPAAGARARRVGRAADVAGEPARGVAQRRLLGALDRRRASSRRSRSRPASRSRSPTASTARCWRRAASRRIARRRSARCTRPIAPR